MAKLLAVWKKFEKIPNRFTRFRNQKSMFVSYHFEIEISNKMSDSNRLSLHSIARPDYGNSIYGLKKIFVY